MHVLGKQCKSNCKVGRRLMLCCCAAYFAGHLSELIIIHKYNACSCCCCCCWWLLLVLQFFWYLISISIVAHPLTSPFCLLSTTKAVAFVFHDNCICVCIDVAWRAFPSLPQSLFLSLSLSLPLLLTLPLTFINFSDFFLCLVIFVCSFLCWLCSTKRAPHAD